jgi:putative MATE family efflux protein
MGNQILFLAIGVITAFTVGTTALVARMVGAGKRGEAEVYARQSLVLTFLAGIILGLIGYLGAEHIIRFMLIASETPDPEIIRLGGIYLRIISMSAPLTFVMMNCYAILQGAGNMKTPLYIMALANILNVVFDYLLIFGIGAFPELGVAGAAIATTGAKNLAAIISLVYMFSRYSPIRLRFTDSFRPEKQRIKDILDIGVASAAEQLIRSSGQMVFTMLVAGLGPIALAANQIIMQAMSISFMPGFGFGLAATTLVGQNLGADQPERAERSGYVASNIAAMFMSCVGILFFFFSHQIATFFTTDPAVQLAAGANLKILAISQPALAFVMVLAGALRGAGDTKWVMFVTLVGTWGSRVAIGWFLGIFLGLGLRGIWIAMVLDNLIRAAMLVTRYRGGQWKFIRVRSVAKSTA